MNGACIWVIAMDDIIITTTLGRPDRRERLHEHRIRHCQPADRRRRHGSHGRQVALAKSLLTNEVDVAMDPSTSLSRRLRMDNLLGTTEGHGSDFNLPSRRWVQGSVDTFLGSSSSTASVWVSMGRATGAASPGPERLPPGHLERHHDQDQRACTTVVCYAGVRQRDLWCHPHRGKRGRRGIICDL